MNSLALHTLVACCAATIASLPAAAATRDYAYTIDVHLRDGKAVQCAVNQPPQWPATSVPALSTEERVEAEVLATQRLRLLSGPRAPYPTPYTAPAIACIALPR